MPNEKKIQYFISRICSVNYSLFFSFLSETPFNVIEKKGNSHQNVKHKARDNKNILSVKPNDEITWITFIKKKKMREKDVINFLLNIALFCLSHQNTLC